MKKAMFILSTVLLFGILSACSTTDDVTVKKNWIFTVTTVTSYTIVSPDMPKVPDQIVVTTAEKDNLTEVEATAAAKTIETEGTITSTIGDMTMKITTTVTKVEKK